MGVAYHSTSEMSASWRVCTRVCRGLFFSRQGSIRLPHPATSSRGFRSSQLLLLATEGEEKIAAILTKALQPTYLQVQDISGGCGSMYEIIINSKQFEGKRLIQQHKMVNEALKDEVPSLHGLTIRIGDPTGES